MTAIKRTLSALVLTGGAALALTPVAAHAADGPSTETQGQPVVERVVDIAGHPGQAVQDTKTALAVTTAAAGSATKSTQGSLAGADTALSGGLPHAPSVG
ncbi:hypothetical protein ACIRBY_38450 [Streptomyces sp. NPDC096136]|uniref:hypothetical protein n=1 Tax=Streptomyces sp. NPDC096136 TaxID=3366076 RepID=UPI0037FE676A